MVFVQVKFCVLAPNSTEEYRYKSFELEDLTNYCNINLMRDFSTLDVLPKYRQVLDSLRTELASGRYRSGEKLPSEADLGKRFGASRITIGRAMRELQNLDLIERRAGSGTYARAGKSSGLTFGLLIPNLGQTEIFEPICQGMAAASQKEQHALLWGNASESSLRSEQAWQLCRQYIDRRVSGVFFAPLEFTNDDGPINRQIVAAFEKARIPVVLLDRCFMPYPERSKYDLVGVDNRRVGHLATAHLLGLGCERIAFLALPHAASTVEARVAGYREALYLNGVLPNPNFVPKFAASDVDAVKEYVERHYPQAFVCANDRTASALMKSLLAIGQRIPEQIKLVGIDDLPFASLLPVPLTTLHQPGREIGMVAMSVMLDRLAQPNLHTRDVLLASHLVVRESSGAS
jgi:GntR family transcriptional regulator of arabinose operon